MPPNVYTTYPLTQTADSVNVLLLDALNTPARSECRCASAAPAAAVR